MANLERRTLEGVGRVYLSDDHDVTLPSVTTVIDQKPTPEGLKKWKEYYDGTDGKQHWRSILNYKGSRGTLVHYNILNEYSDTDIGGRNEEEAEADLKESGRWQEYKQDMHFARHAWDSIRNQRGITQKSVLNVECFVENTDVGYAGQFDLLYIDEDGDVVLSDLKTSKRVYDKHQLQTSAYWKAVPLKIDKLEIVRIHPDSKSWEIVHDTDWTDNKGDPISREERYEEFVELRESMNEDLSQIEEEGIDDG